MGWVLFSIIGFIALFPTLWLAIKGKELANKLLFKGTIEEASVKSWPGDLVATAIFFIYSVLLFVFMPK